jgi:hypothetical protein
MGVLFSPDEANHEAILAQQANQPQPSGLDQARDAIAGPGDRQAGQPQPTGDGMGSSRIVDRVDSQFPLIGKDGQQEPNKPIEHVDNLDAAGNKIGSSEYMYTNYQPNGVKLNGYIDRDAQGNITEFAVRKPALYKDQKDVFMVFRAPPGQPFTAEQQQKIFGSDDEGGHHKGILELLRPDVSADERAANQRQLNAERPLAGNLVHNLGNQVVAVRLDPETGQRFTIRDMRTDPMTGRPMNIDPATGQHTHLDATGKMVENSHPELCWQGPNGTIYRVDVAKLPDADKQDIGNATWHGNLRAPLSFLPRRAPQPPQVPATPRT